MSQGRSSDVESDIAGGLGRGMDLGVAWIWRADCGSNRRPSREPAPAADLLEDREQSQIPVRAALRYDCFWRNPAIALLSASRQEL